jgi:hypothetical protein
MIYSKVQKLLRFNGYDKIIADRTDSQSSYFITGLLNLLDVILTGIHSIRIKKLLYFSGLLTGDDVCTSILQNKDTRVVGRRSVCWS